MSDNWVGRFKEKLREKVEARIAEKKLRREMEEREREAEMNRIRLLFDATVERGRQIRAREEIEREQRLQEQYRRLQRDEMDSAIGMLTEEYFVYEMILRNEEIKRYSQWMTDPDIEKYWLLAARCHGFQVESLEDVFAHLREGKQEGLINWLREELRGNPNLETAEMRARFIFEEQGLYDPWSLLPDAEAKVEWARKERARIDEKKEQNDTLVKNISEYFLAPGRQGQETYKNFVNQVAVMPSIWDRRNNMVIVLREFNKRRARG